MEKTTRQIRPLGENLNLTHQEVEQVARLARLALTEKEKENFAQQLGKILGLMEKLNTVDLEGVAPTAHPFSLKTVWREDTPYRFSPAEPILDNAPEREEGFFKVKKVIEG